MDQQGRGIGGRGYRGRGRQGIGGGRGSWGARVVANPSWGSTTAPGRESRDSRGQRYGLGRPTAGASGEWQGDGARHCDHQSQVVFPAGASSRVPLGRPATWGIPRAAAPTTALYLLLGGLWLCINHCLLVAQFDHEKMHILYLYDVDVRAEDQVKCDVAGEALNPDLSAVKAEVFGVCAAQFPAQTLAYDAQRNLVMSSGPLPEGDHFRVAVQDRVLHVALKLVKAVPWQERAASRCQGCVAFLWDAFQLTLQEVLHHAMHS